MAYYNVCPDCGSNLDPGERCDCQNIRAKEQEKNRLFFSQMLRTEKSSGQMSFAFEHSGGGAIGAWTVLLLNPVH